MLSDIRHAFRSLGKSSSFTCVVLLTLALGIGVNTSMYTLVDVLLFRSAPFPESERLLLVQSRTAQGQREGYSFSEFEEMRSQVSATAENSTGQPRPFDSFTAFSYWNDALAEPGQPAERLDSVNATADFFSTFRVQPMLGRAFTADEETPGKNQVALLSFALWQSRFGGDPKIIGRSIRLNAEQVTIIGVMPAAFTYPLFFGKVDLWRPITIPRHIVESRNNHFFGIIGRLSRDTTQGQAEARLSPFLSRWAHDNPQFNSGRALAIKPLQKATMDSTGRFMVWLLFGVGVVVLLLACFNIANLQLARAANKTRDLAIRSSLGASRATLILHQLVESMILALGGGILGLVVAIWTNALVGQAVRIGDAGSLDLPLNGPVLIVAFLASMASGVLFGLLPAWIASRCDLVTALKQQTRGSSASQRTHRLRHVLIVGQVALALALLSTAGVMIHGFGALLKKDKGWDTNHVLAANIRLPEQSTYISDDQRRLAIEKIARRLAQIPNAEHTAICSTAPLFGYSKSSAIQVQGITSDDPAKQPLAGYTMIASDYFSTLGIPLLEGRTFPEELKGDSPPIAIINQTMAHHFWPNDSAIGKKFGERVGDSVVWREVIGVVGDIQFALHVANPATNFQVYKPLAHEPWGYLFLLVRGPVPASYKNDVRKVVADIDPDVAIQEMYTIPEAIERFDHNIVVVDNTIGGFALLGLILASLGLYGVVSNLVAQRTSEFGIRLALGAKPGAVVGLVLRTGIRLTLIGLVIGCVLAFALNRALQAAMPRMADSEPLTITFVALVLFAISLLACWLPARRATKIDPIIALRAD
jgi:predicted permease